MFTKSLGANLHMPPRIVLITPLRNHMEQPPPHPLSPLAFHTSSRHNLHAIAWSKPTHEAPHRPENTFPKSCGASLYMLPRIVQIQPLRNRPEQTSTYRPLSSKYKLFELARSQPPHATPDRPDKTLTKSSGANIHRPR